MEGMTWFPAALPPTRVGRDHGLCALVRGGTESCDWCQWVDWSAGHRLLRTWWNQDESTIHLPLFYTNLAEHDLVLNFICSNSKISCFAEVTHMSASFNQLAFVKNTFRQLPVFPSTRKRQKLKLTLLGPWNGHGLHKMDPADQVS